MSDATILSSNLNLLNRSLIEVKAIIGQFLTNEKVLTNLTPRIENLVANTTGAAQQASKLLKGKQIALLQVQKNLETEAMQFISTASDFKTKVDTDPLYSFLKTPMKTWGLRQAQILAGLAKQSAVLLGPAASLSKRLLGQNKDVQTIQKEVESTEKAAAGTGVLPKIQGILSGTIASTVGTAAGALAPVLKPLAWAGIGIAALYFAPMLLRGKK